MKLSDIYISLCNLEQEAHGSLPLAGMQLCLYKISNSIRFTTLKISYSACAVNDGKMTFIQTKWEVCTHLYRALTPKGGYCVIMFVAFITFNCACPVWLQCAPNSLSLTVVSFEQRQRGYSLPRVAVTHVSEHISHSGISANLVCMLDVLEFSISTNKSSNWWLRRTFSPQLGVQPRSQFLKKILSPLVILSMEKTMVTVVISELKSISRHKIFRETGPGLPTGRISLTDVRLSSQSPIKSFYLSTVSLLLPTIPKLHVTTCSPC